MRRSLYGREGVAGFFCVWGGGRGGLLWRGLLCVDWGVGGAARPSWVPAAMRRFAIKNLQPNHVPYCGTSPLKQAAFLGAAASGAGQNHYYLF